MDGGGSRNLAVPPDAAESAPRLVHFFLLPSGWPGARATAARLAQLARQSAFTDPEIARLARSIFLRSCGRLDRSVALALQEWTQLETVYRDDPAGLEWVESPGDLSRGRLAPGAPIRGDCDDIAGLVAALACGLALPARFILAQFQGESAPSHIWCEVADRGGADWYACDPTRPSPVPPVAKLEAIGV